MVDQDAPAADLDALLQGHAWVDLSSRQAVRVCGRDAIAWLHDLLTADIAGLAPGASCRSLLLTPTGRIRADVQVLRRPDDVLLVQSADQPEGIRPLLAPYVLSSDVSLEDVTADLEIVALPCATALPDDLSGFAPSCLGPGIDAVMPAGEPAQHLRSALLDAGFEEADTAVAEAWRIVEGIPRMGTDFDQRSLPAETGLDDVIDAVKGCFLGQESVARVRNLGHPPHVLRHVQGSRAFDAGGSVLAGDTIVGSVTSATRLADRCVGFVRIAWAAATTQLTDSDGHPLVDVASGG
jgi:folate-binding protein YgfZ